MVGEGKGGGGGGGNGAGSLKEEDEDEEEVEEEMRMRCLCTIGGSREGSSICVRREKEAAWNGGALEQHCRCRQDSHRLRHSGWCVNGRDSEQVCAQHLHAYCVKCNHYLGEGQVSKVRGGCILGLCRMMSIKGV